MSDYNDAIRLAPTLAVAYTGRGNVHAGRGNVHYSKAEYDLAISDYNEAIRLAPTFAVASTGRGNVHYSMGGYDLASTDYTRSLLSIAKLAAPALRLVQSAWVPLGPDRVL
jgi:tetratricopeptide (TPR) repeat protein